MCANKRDICRVVITCISMLKRFRFQNTSTQPLSHSAPPHMHVCTYTCMHTCMHARNAHTHTQHTHINITYKLKDITLYFTVSLLFHLVYVRHGLLSATILFIFNQPLYDSDHSFCQFYIDSLQKSYQSGKYMSRERNQIVTNMPKHMSVSISHFIYSPTLASWNRKKGLFYHCLCIKYWMINYIVFTFIFILVMIHYYIYAEVTSLVSRYPVVAYKSE